MFRQGRDEREEAAGTAASDGSEKKTRIPVNGKEPADHVPPADMEEHLEGEAETGTDDRLADALEEAAAANERYLRLQAEWENFRKRTASEREAERARATERLVESLLPVLDDFDRALAHARTVEMDEHGTSFVEGVDSIHGKLMEALERAGVESIDPEGQAFDMTCHQAVGQREDAEQYDETVCEVYQPGYKLAGKILRPAMVITTTGGKPRPVESGE